MGDSLKNIDWVKKSKDFVDLFKQESSLNMNPLDSGLEAEVIKICTADSCYVLKVWNRDSRPDVNIQYHLLEVLYSHGVAVSKPYGWGMSEGNHQVLLTSYDGVPIHKVDKLKLTELAKMLCSVHRLPLEVLDSTAIPSHDFVAYFYPRINEHLDIKHVLNQLLGNTTLKQNCLIHGDFNLGNVLEADGTHTIIDWTNGQLGDPRYDIAWSIVLIRIYVGERYGSVYRSAFLAENHYSENELKLFEAIACLRWILLNRIAHLPKRNNTIARVKKILRDDAFLDEALL